MQRWERQIAFPVHRITTANGEVVYAFKTEVDRWQAIRDAKGPSDIAATWPGVPAAPRTPWRLAWYGALAGAAAMITILVSVIVATPFVIRTSRGLRLSPVAPSGPAAWRIDGRALKVFNANDEELWAFTFPFELDPSAYLKQDGDQPTLVTIADLDSDGNKELLFVARATDPANSRLYCFNVKGEPRFSVRPDARVRFGDTEYAPPFDVQEFFLTVDPDLSRTIWLVAAHHAWFPTVLQKIAHTGDVVGQYWNSGPIHLVRESRIRGQRVLLVAGSSHEHCGPSLAVLDYDDPAGSWPSDDPRYRCSSCSPKPPVAAFAVPFEALWSEMNVMPRVDDVVSTGSGETTMMLHGYRRGRNDDLLRWEAFLMFDSSYNADVQVTSGLPQMAIPLRDSPVAKVELNREGRRRLFPILRWIGGQRIAPAGSPPNPADSLLVTPPR